MGRGWAGRSGQSQLEAKQLEFAGKVGSRNFLDTRLIEQTKKDRVEIKKFLVFK